MPSPRQTRRAAAAWGALALTASVLASAAAPVALATSVQAAGAATATGPAGQTLTVAKSSDLAAAGERIVIRGSGYPTFKGIYVAVCKTPAPGERPSPCGGGADTSGDSQTSQWISSNPPTYAKGLTVPYGTGGTFEATIFASPELPDGTDCRDVGCSIVTRTDHTRTSDRSQDVLVPVTFAAAEDGGNALASVVIVAIVVGFVLLLVAVGAVLIRRKRRLHEPDEAAA